MTDEELLKAEYLKLQDLYEIYDQRALQIKGWIGAGSIAGIAIGLDRGDTSGGLVWLLISAVCACFWYLETKWKLFQYAFRGRIEVIEEYFRGGRKSDIAPLQIYSDWFEHYDSSWRSIRRAAFQGFVSQPYVLIIGICVLLASLS